MMRDYFRNVCRVRLRGCEPERCLDALLAAKIPFWSVRRPDEFTLLLRLRRSDADFAGAVIRRCQCEPEMTALRSLRQDLSRLKKRWALMIGLPAALILSILLSNMIAQVTIRGCETVSEVRVRRALDDLGVRFGAWGPSLRSEELRNGMLHLIPELRWVGVNWSGMRAAVQVAERDRAEPPLERTGAAHMVACTDGVVTKVEALNGQAVCAPGDAVRKGQVLISGVVDLERLRVTTRALGEVYADTRREIRIKTPDARLAYTPEERAGFCLWLRVGRKRIKIFGNSGIMMDGCVKMINRGTMRLPGDIEIPLGVCIETFRHASVRPVPLSDGEAAAMLEKCADRLLDDVSVAGSVTSAETALVTEAGAYCLTKTAHCREMIARSAEIPILELEQYGQTDQRGTDRTAH